MSENNQTRQVQHAVEIAHAFEDVRLTSGDSAREYERAIQVMAASMLGVTLEEYKQMRQEQDAQS